MVVNLGAFLSRSFFGSAGTEPVIPALSSMCKANVRDDVLRSPRFRVFQVLKWLKPSFAAVSDFTVRFLLCRKI